MELLVLGLSIWFLLHLLPVTASGLRRSLITKIGLMPYKGLFALGILASVAFMVLGWRSVANVTSLYDIYDMAIVPALIMILCGFVLMAASNLRSNFKRTFRHPQLLGFTLWSAAHVLLNGELRAVVLFGGLCLWSLVTMALLNRRDGVFEKPAKELPHKGVMVCAIGFVLFIVAVKGHAYLGGVDLFLKAN